MKKYFMFIITLAVLFATAITQISEYRALPKPSFQKPFLEFTSTKFGQIKNIVWLDNFISPENALLILSAKPKDNISYSYLSYLDIASGKSTLLAEFPTHPYLSGDILYTSPFSGHSIITAYRDGVVKTTMTRDDKQNFQAEQTLLPINGFAEANSMDFKNNLYYSKLNDNLLYVKNFGQSAFPFFETNSQLKRDMTYLRKPYRIINANTLDHTLTYTSLTPKGIDLYSINFEGLPLTPYNKPLIHNVLQAQGIEDGYGFIGMNFSDDPSKSLNNQTLTVFMVRRNRSDYHPIVELNTIPFNTDPLGGIPSMSSTTFNEDYTLVYTCYDENHKGKLVLSTNSHDPKVILEENLFGPVDIARKTIIDSIDPSDKDDSRRKYILYFTLDNQRVNVKICDEHGKLVKDLTNIFNGTVN